LSADEQDRRIRFSQQFKASRSTFSDLPLTKTRNTAVHRRGYAPYEVRIAGRFGVTHVGGPTSPVPVAETPTITDPAYPPAMARSSRIEPHFSDFTIDGQPLFECCHQYLSAANALIAKGRTIAATVHGTNALTQPPDA
jgi:hypothetical protein